MFLPNLKFVVSPVPGIIAIGVLVAWGLQTPNLGKEEAVRGRDGSHHGTVRKSAGKFL